MKTLIGELNKDCERFFLRYQLFEETDDEHYGKSFFSLSVELCDNDHDEFAEARDFTSNRFSAEDMLKSIYNGVVTPVCLSYIIEDYLGAI